MGFDVHDCVVGRDIEVLACALVQVDRSDLALQLRASHLARRVWLPDDDVVCLSNLLAMAAASQVDDQHVAATMWRVILHVRLLLNCSLVNDESSEDRLCDDIQCAADRFQLDPMAIGEADGLCRILDSVQRGSHRVSQAEAILSRATRVAATGPDSVHERIRCRVQRVMERGGWHGMEPAPDFDALCLTAQALEIRACQRRLDASRLVGSVPPRSAAAFNWTQHGDAVFGLMRALLNGRRYGPDANGAAEWVVFMGAALGTSKPVHRGRLLSMAMQCVARSPGLLDQPSVTEVLVRLLKEDFARKYMLKQDNIEFPDQVFLLVTQGKGKLSEPAMQKCLCDLASSDCHALAASSGSAGWMLDRMLARMGTHPAALFSKRARFLAASLVREPRAMRDSAEALARPLLLAVLAGRGTMAEAWIECLLLLDSRQRVPMIESMAKREHGIHLREADAVALTRPVEFGNVAGQTAQPPTFVAGNPVLLAQWMGASLAETFLAGFGGSEGGVQLAVELSGFHRRQHASRGTSGSESFESLSCAARVAVRVGRMVPIHVIDDAIIELYPGLRPGWDLPRLLAFSGLVASQRLLKGYGQPVLDSDEAALLARLMCAALMLEMHDDAACLEHLQAVQAHLRDVETNVLTPEGLERMFSQLQAARAQRFSHGNALLPLV